MTRLSEIADLFGSDGRFSQLEAEVRGLKTGGGSGTSGGGMETRIVRLESDMEHVKRDVGELRADMKTVVTDIATLKERVAHLPGKGFIVTVSASTLALLTAAIVFADKLRALVG